MARPRKFDERTVLTAARQQFWHHGYEATSMAELCEATGVASQSLYGAFGSKHDLFVRTLDDYCTRQVAGLEASQHSPIDAWQWLMDAVTFDDDGRLGLTLDGCYLSGSAAALARVDDDVHDASRRTYEQILQIFVTTLERTKRDGTLRADADIDETALAFLTTMQGIEFLRKSGLKDEQFDKAKSAAIATLNRAYATVEA